MFFYVNINKGKLETEIYSSYAKLRSNKTDILNLNNKLTSIENIIEWHKGYEKNGYQYIGTHVLEHRATAEKVLKRELRNDEVVHHINGNPLNNNVDNLCVMSNLKHEFYHSWLKWRLSKNMGYPSRQEQRLALSNEYQGIILSERCKSNELEHFKKLTTRGATFEQR